MKRNRVKTVEGMTLIEIIIAVSILFVVIAVSMSLFIFGNTTYSKGDAQFGIQSDVRVGSDFVQNHVRYATYVELIDISGVQNIPDEFTEDPEDEGIFNYNYVYFQIEPSENTGRLVNKVFDENIGEYGGYRVRFQSLPTIHSISFGIGEDFSLITQIIGIEKDSNRNVNQSYEISSEFALPNIQNDRRTIVDATEDGVDPELEDIPEGYSIAIRYSNVIGFISDQGDLGEENGETQIPFKLDGDPAGTDNDYFVLTFTRPIPINGVLEKPSSSSATISGDNMNVVRIDYTGTSPQGFGNNKNVSIKVTDGHTEVAVTLQWTNTSDGWKWVIQ